MNATLAVWGSGNDIINDLFSVEETAWWISGDVGPDKRTEGLGSGEGKETDGESEPGPEPSKDTCSSCVVEDLLFLKSVELENKGRRACAVDMSPGEVACRLFCGRSVGVSVVSAIASVSDLCLKRSPNKLELDFLRTVDGMVKKDGRSTYRRGLPYDQSYSRQRP